MAFVQIPLSNTLRMVRTDNQGSNLPNFDNRLLHQENYFGYSAIPYAQKISSSDNILVQFATDYNLTGGFTDWFLPSRDELNQMYVNLKSQGVGDFSTSAYWSSSEESASWGYYQNFSDGSQTQNLKTATNHVRACRTFTASVGSYSLRDTGPAGGLIFYIDGTTYYEAAPSDQSSSQVWSNVTSTLIGATGTAIGTGQTNTTAIINQAGHTDSAAKLCDDLSVTGNTLTAKIYDITDTLVVDKTSSITSILASTTFTYYDLLFTIATEGYYYLVLDFDSGTETYQSEIFQIDGFDNDRFVKIEYNTSENDGIVYNNDQTFVIRLEGRIVEYDAGQNKETYTSFDETLVNLNSYPKRSFRLEYGAIPRYMIEKLNLALAHQVFKVNDVEYQNDDAADADFVKDGEYVTNMYKGAIKLQQVTYEEYLSATDDEAPDTFYILIDENDNKLLIRDQNVDYNAIYKS